MAGPAQAVCRRTTNSPEANAQPGGAFGASPHGLACQARRSPRSRPLDPRHASALFGHNPARRPRAQSVAVATGSKAHTPRMRRLTGPSALASTSPGSIPAAPSRIDDRINATYIELNTLPRAVCAAPPWRPVRRPNRLALPRRRPSHSTEESKNATPYQRQLDASSTADRRQRNLRALYGSSRAARRQLDARSTHARRQFYGRSTAALRQLYASSTPTRRQLDG